MQVISTVLSIGHRAVGVSASMHAIPTATTIILGVRSFGQPIAAVTRGTATAVARGIGVAASPTGITTAAAEAAEETAMRACATTSTEETTDGDTASAETTVPTAP